MIKGQKLLQYAIIIIGIIGLFSLLPNSFYRLRYYTYLSNAVVVLFYVYLLHCKKLNTNLSRLKTGVTIIVLLTFIVYNVLLLPKVSPEEFWTVRNFSLHYAVPILTCIDWLLFDKQINYKWFDPFTWAIFPLLYCFVSLSLGYFLKLPIPNEKHSPYPYFFLNINEVGWHGLLLYCSVITIFYIGVGYMMIVIKKWQNNIIKKTSN